MQSRQAASGHVYGSQWQESWDCIPAYSLFKQARSMAPCVGSRRSIWSTPVSSSGFKSNIFDARHRQHIDNTDVLAAEFLVILHRQQDMRRLAPVGNEYRTVPGGFLCSAGVLIERA